MNDAIELSTGHSQLRTRNDRDALQSGGGNG